jgi:lipopolysaccharide biosynthesis glycosyltransferase
MTSIFEHTSSPVCVHILHDDTLTGDNRARFIKTAEKFGRQVRFIDVSESINKMNSYVDIDKAGGGFSRGALFRLFLPDLLDIPKVIYSDCDVVVNLDIAELWSINIENYFLAAVSGGGCGLYGIVEYIRLWAMRYDSQKYFGTGALLMNLDRIRRMEPNMTRKTADFFARYAVFAELPDMDVLNVFFQNNVLPMDKRFVCLTNVSKETDNVIIHFEIDKPWRWPSREASHQFYWDTFRRSGWGDQYPDAIAEMYWSASDQLHRSSSDCLKRLLRAVRYKLFTKHIIKLRHILKLLRGVPAELRRRRSERS